jgi:S1-C subfamily serine protease
MDRLRSTVLTFVLGFASCALVIRFLFPLPAGAASPDGGFANASDVVAKVGEAVVSLDSFAGAPRSQGFLPRLFGLSAAGDNDPTSVASGVIISKQGYIVTNNHVVEDGGRLRARLADGREFDATVVGSDPYTDLAVVKIAARNLKAARMGDSRRVRAGDMAVAIGNPLGFENSVSVGVVSAVRTGPIRIDGHTMGDLIQTDASINQGNSGGGLFTAGGELVGINTAIMAAPGGSGSIGIGFAIPTHQVRPVTETLIAKGRILRPWLGVKYRPSESGRLLRRARQGAGVLVEGVLPDSPAARAGLRPADILRQLGDCPIRSTDDIYCFVGMYQPGDQVRARVLRGGQEKTLVLTLSESRAK